MIQPPTCRAVPIEVYYKGGYTYENGQILCLKIEANDLFYTAKLDTNQPSDKYQKLKFSVLDAGYKILSLETEVISSVPSSEAIKASLVVEQALKGRMLDPTKKVNITITNPDFTLERTELCRLKIEMYSNHVQFIYGKFEKIEEEERPRKKNRTESTTENFELFPSTYTEKTLDELKSEETKTEEEIIELETRLKSSQDKLLKIRSEIKNKTSCGTIDCHVQ